jgi:cytochrome b
MTPNNSTSVERIRVWDLPTRVGHWLLVATFFASYFTGDSEEWRLVHVITGAALSGILLFRLYWGFAGSRYAQFRSFMFSPLAVLAYLRGLFKRDSTHWIGHNPAGSYAIYILLLLGIAIAVTGFAAYFDIGGDPVVELHDELPWIMLIVVGVHIVGAIVSSLLHRENLIRSMITGYKRGPREAGISSNRVAGLLLLAIAIAAAIALGLLPP